MKSCFTGSQMGGLCARGCWDVLNTPGYNKQSHKCKPHFGMVSANGQLGHSLESFLLGGSAEEYCIPSFWRNLGWFPGSHASAWAAVPCCTSRSCPAPGHIPSLLGTLCVLPGIPLAAELSCLISLSLCKQGRGGWKRGKCPCIPEKQGGFGSSSTAACLHKQIPHLVITLCVSNANKTGFVTDKWCKKGKSYSHEGYKQQPLIP